MRHFTDTNPQVRDRLVEIEGYLKRGPLSVETSQWLIGEVKRLRTLEEGLRFEANDYLEEMRRLQAAMSEAWNSTRKTFSAGFEAGLGYPNATVVPESRAEDVRECTLAAYTEERPCPDFQCTACHG